MTKEFKPARVKRRNGRVGIIARHPLLGHWLIYAETKLDEGYSGDGETLGTPDGVLTGHGGITFFGKLKMKEFAKKNFYGCDYAHFMDDEHESTIMEVESDLFALMDSVARYEAIYPKILIFRRVLENEHNKFEKYIAHAMHEKVSKKGGLT